MDSARQAVAATGLLVAAMRAEESARDDRLFTDPFAERLAGEEGRRLLADAVAATGRPSAQIVIRTRFWDDALLRANADGVSQVVILAAGMDARAYRLPLRAGTTVYEVDQPQMIATKDQRLAVVGPRCRRVAVGMDLADDWPKVLQSTGFTSLEKTVWLVEGLLQYLDASVVDALFARIDALSAPGSVLMYDIVGTTLMEAPFLQPTLKFMQQLRAVDVQHRHTGCPRRRPRLDRQGHRCGRARKRVASMGAPGRSPARGRCAARLLHRGHQSLTAYATTAA